MIIWILQYIDTTWYAHWCLVRNFKSSKHKRRMRICFCFKRKKHDFLITQMKKRRKKRIHHILFEPVSSSSINVFSSSVFLYAKKKQILCQDQIILKMCCRWAERWNSCLLKPTLKSQSTTFSSLKPLRNDTQPKINPAFWWYFIFFVNISFHPPTTYL